MENEALRITILDHNFERICACESAVRTATRELGIKAIVTQISEPPYLARLDIYDRMPALDINGLIWSRKSSEAFTHEEVVQLLQRHYQTGQE